MQSRLLQNFLMVAEVGSITEAAKLLNISQPALTKSIQQLETDLDVSLFERIPKGVALTRFGNIFHHHAKAMENEYRHAVSRIQELRDGRSGAIRIGAGPMWLEAILPPIVTRFQRDNPGVHMSLVGGVIDTLLPNLMSGELDIMCASLDFPNTPEIVKKPLFNLQHVLIADPANPLAKVPEVTAEDIHAYSWMVLKSDYVGNDRISSFFASNNLPPPQIVFETTSIHSLLQGLRNGNYIAHIPTQLLPLANSIGLKQIRLNNYIWETEAGYAYRHATKNSVAVSHFMAMLNQENMEK